MVAETPKTRKAAAPPLPYIPQVEVIDYSDGTFSVQSQTNPSEYYLVDILNTTCTCKAGQTSFQSCKYVPHCKHLTAARIVANALTDLIQQQQSREAAQAARQQAVAQAAATPKPMHPAVAALLDCYA